MWTEPSTSTTLTTRTVSQQSSAKRPLLVGNTHTHIQGLSLLQGKGGRRRQLYHCVLWVSSRFNLKPFDLRGLRSRRGRHVNRMMWLENSTRRRYGSHVAEALDTLISFISIQIWVSFQMKANWNCRCVNWRCPVESVLRCHWNPHTAQHSTLRYHTSEMNRGRILIDIIQSPVPVLETKVLQSERED